MLNDFRLIIKKSTYHIYYLFFILGLGFSLFCGLLQSKGVWIYGDGGFPSSYDSFQNLFRESFYTWHSRDFLGIDSISYSGPLRITYTLTLKILFCFLHDINLVELVWYILLFWLSNISVYLFCYELTNERLGSSVSGVFYSLSLYATDRLATNQMMYHCLAIAPLLFYFYIKFCKNQTLVRGLLCAVAFSFTLPNQHVSFMVGTLLILYFIYCFIKNLNDRSSLKDFIKNNVFLVLLTLFINSYYFIPFIQTGTFRETQALEKFKVGAVNTSYSQLIFDTFRGLSSHTSKVIYHSPSFVFAGFIFICGCLLTLFGKRSSKTIFFAVVLLIHVYFVSFAKISLHYIYKFILKVPLLQTYVTWPDTRYSIFGILFCLSFLIAVSISNLKLSFRNKFLKNIAIIFFLLVILLQTDFLFLFHKEARFFKFFKHPFDYKVLCNFLNLQKEDFRISVLPPYNTIKHSWSYQPTLLIYDFMETKHPLFGLVTAEGAHGNSREVILTSLNLINSNPKTFIKLLKLVNVRYIVLYRDITNFSPEKFYIDKNLIGYYKNILNYQYRNLNNLNFSKLFNLYECTIPQKIIYCRDST